MSDWRELLREADGDESLPADHAQQIRQATIAAAAAAVVPASVWPIRLAFASVALVMLLGGAGDHGRVPGQSSEAPGQAPTPADERRQLQFSTPGGTRIIWELNPNFSLTETLP
ncbi:MAG TPA: hypothetical protein VJ813_08870 [Vicinamibacterales bacterium]|nr:hypothetical protein [Vicinamibacterales bacterium]